MNKKRLLFTIFIVQVAFMLQAQNSNFVGSIPGVVDVSPMGAATYTIPIEVVPGTQGMQPNLSIVYNSFSGMGLLGMKWDLSGLSSITRCGQSRYFDNNITAIQFTGSVFLLDGVRLLTTGSGTIEFAPEAENFMRIFPQNNYDHFIAYTDDGSIIEYGNSPDSKQKLETGNNILSWRINKITDSNGNSMTYSYSDYGFGEVLISRISYSGNPNAGIRPYASVEFGYRSDHIPDTLGRNTLFVSGYCVSQSKLLETITIYHGYGTRVRQYKFNYHLNGHRFVHLKEVLLYGEIDNIQLNATTIFWDPQISNELTIHGGSLPGFNNGGYMLCGDFNGDGYSDYVIYGKGVSRDTLETYMRNPHTGTFEKQGVSLTHKSLLNDETNCYFYKADLQGSGCDNLIIAEKSSHHLTTYFFKISSQTYTIDHFDQLFFGDFDGDGTTDILFMSRNNNSCSFKMYLSGVFYHNTGIPPTNVLCKVRLGDFDGKGKTDVEIHLKNGNGTDDIKRYWLGNNGFTQYNTQSTGSYNNTVRYSGDFNGDGITDLLVFDVSGSPRWKIAFGKGNGTYTDLLGLSIPNFNSQATVLPDGSSAPTSSILIADLDGDGKDDILQLDGKSVKILYSKGYINGQYCYTAGSKELTGITGIPKKFSISDFNNDGFLDIIAQAEQTQYSKPNPNIYCLHDKKYNCVQNITDGMGKEIKLFFTPTYLPAKDFNTSRNVIRKYFNHLLTKLEVSNGLNNDLNSFQYHYRGAVFSWLKRSFLGFSEFFCTSVAKDKQDIFTFSVDAGQEVLIPNTQSTYYYSGGTVVHGFGTGYNISLKTLSNKRYLQYSNPRVSHKLSGIRTDTKNILDASNRIVETEIKTYDEFAFRDFHQKLVLTETSYYTYDTIPLDNNKPSHKKIVLTKTVVKREYPDFSTFPLIDTLTCAYTPDGNLFCERKGNTDGAITATYENYTPAGLYGTKTLSAAGCASRTETYTYDATQRFVDTITNPLGHKTVFTYDLKTGNKLSETDPNGLTTTFSYDPFGNLKQVDYPDGTQTKNTMQWFKGTRIPNASYTMSTTTTAKPTLTVYYDKLGREVCRMDDAYYYDTRYNVKGETVQTSYPYQPLSQPDTSKLWTKHTYDDFGRNKTLAAPYTNLLYEYDNRMVSVIDSMRNNITSWKNYDAFGRINSAFDTGGIILYAYSINSSSRQVTTITTNGTVTAATADLWGNRLSVSEPNAGTIVSAYNNFNELISQTDANGNATKYQYDKLGRVTQKQFIKPFSGSQTYTYFYDNTSLKHKGIGKLSQIARENTLEESFTYDHLSRLTEYTKRAGLYYTCKYTYNTNGQLDTLYYPSGFAINHTYSSTGTLKEIIRSSDGSSIYYVASRNAYGAPKLCAYGNDLATVYTYSPCGLLIGVHTGNKIFGTAGEEGPGVDTASTKGFNFFHNADSTIMNYRYTYNALGLMTSRSESVANLQEEYQYDLLDRLTGITPKTEAQQTFVYANNGNILNNSQVGSYLYHNTKKNAVTKITPINNSVIPSDSCAVLYNVFNQPILIDEGGHRLIIAYDANRQRSFTSAHKNNILTNKRYYIDKGFEYETDYTPDSTNILRACHYIYGDRGAVALHIHTVEAIDIDTLMIGDPGGGINTSSIISDFNHTYYIHTDHLGSFCVLTDTAKQVVQRNHFDPWGNYPIQYDTIYESGSGKPQIIESHFKSFPITNRGFTGHEHYPQFKIINMNGRLYDPVICRFFSPDNFVLDNSFTQDFNRYSYARNNPLMYTDPTGWVIEYNSFRDRVNAFFLRIFDKEFRQDFRELKKSEDIFVLNFNRDGKNSTTYDGIKTFLNYSLTDEYKEVGETNFSLMKHEVRHGSQLLHGKFGFENKSTGRAIKIGNVWIELKQWKPVNYDVYDELDAHKTSAGNSVWRSDTRRAAFMGFKEERQLEIMRETYPNIEQDMQLNNSVTEKVKNDNFFMYPYRPRR